MCTEQFLTNADDIDCSDMQTEQNRERKECISLLNECLQYACLHNVSSRIRLLATFGTNRTVNLLVSKETTGRQLTLKNDSVPLRGFERCSHRLQEGNAAENVVKVSH
jgi:hypothetical protein